MKRLWVILGALAMVCALNVTEAGAVKLDRKDIGWNNEYATSPFDRVKPKTQITASGTVNDTTAAFSLLGCALPFSKPDGSNADSASIASLVFMTDSSAAATNDLTVYTVTLQGSEDGVNWETVYTIATQSSISSGDKAFSVPLWVQTGEGKGAVGTKVNPLFRRQLRAIISGVTGNMYAARCFLWFWNE